MGQGAGGDVRMMGDPFAYSAIYEFGQALVKGVLLDDRGRRFVGEDNYGTWVGKVLLRDHPVSYLIVDQAIWDEIHEAAKNVLTVAAQADSIAELARAANINQDVMENTIDFYNEHAAKGEDPTFSKDEHYLVPLENGPFYALSYPAAGVGFFTTGGLRINGKAEALDPFGETVPGLYAAGRNAFAVTAEQYPGSGVSVCEGLTFGRIAGKAAAALEASS
jgi:3-oxo-5alpha-steroid 4-dehydrogenase